VQYSPVLPGVFLSSQFERAMYCTEKTKAAIWPLSSKGNKGADQPALEHATPIERIFH